LTRRVVKYRTISRDRELLDIIIIEQEGINKESLKKENKCSKTHEVLVSNGPLYEFK
jgi:hypothetical protein